MAHSDVGGRVFYVHGPRPHCRSMPCHDEDKYSTGGPHDVPSTPVRAHGLRRTQHCATLHRGTSTEPCSMG